MTVGKRFADHPTVARPGSRAAVLRRNEGTRILSPSDDEVGGDKARSARSERQRAEQSNPTSFTPPLDK